MFELLLANVSYTYLHVSEVL